MSGGQLDTVLRHLRKLVGSPAAEDSDGRLLERFLTQRDEAAFTALLARHGPMVWGLCRRLLPEPHDAEDAFQATFLVLVRRARSLDRRGSLAGWLHGVAGRVALRARSGRHRERALSEEVPAMGATDPAAEAARHELRALIDEELRRLPEKYRGAVLLCDVQGRSHEEAARQLGCPPGSMSWRLARGRAMLRHGLERRGVALSAALLAGLLAEEASAAVPAALAEATARAALLAASGGALAGPVAAMADGTARALAPARLKLAAALLALGVLAAGAGVATHRALTAHLPALAPPGDQVANEEPAPPPKDAGDKPEPAAPPAEKPAPRADAQGDPLPPGAVARLGSQRLRQADGVSAFAFSPDGKLLATGGGDADEWLHVWDVQTGKLVRRLPESGVKLIAFTPDGKTLAVVARTGPVPVRLWDLESGREERRFTRLRFLPDAVAFTPDGETLFAVLWEEDGVSTWDTTTGHPLKTYLRDIGPFSAFALSPDGKTIAVVTHSRDKVVLVNTARDTRLEFSRESRLFTNVAFSPDGKRLAVSSVYEPTVILDAETLKELAATDSPHPHRMIDIGFTPDGKELVGIDMMGEACAWDTATGKYLRSCTKPGNYIPAAALAPDRRLVAFVEEREPIDQHAPRLIDLTTGKERLQLGGHEAAVNSVAFSPDGKLLASTGTDGVTVLWDLPTGREVWRVADKGGRIGASAFSPSGRVLAAPGESGCVELFDLATRKSLAVLGQETAFCRSLAFSPYGRILAVSGLNKMLTFWDVDRAEIIARPLLGRGAYPVALDRAGRFAAAGRSGAWLGELFGKTEPRWLSIRGADSPALVALAPEGDTLAVGSSAEGRVCLFDAATGARRRQVSLADESLGSVALSNGGRILAVGGAKGGVTLFDTSTGERLLSLTGHDGPVHALTFSADGTRLASGGADTTVLVWDLARVVHDAPGTAPLDDAKIAALWRDFGNPDNTFDLWATAVLSSDPARAVAFFKDHVKPDTSDHDERLARAVADLQDEDFKVRERALEELRRFGGEAIPPLRELQRTATDPRLQARLRAFLTMAEVDGVTPPAEVPRELRAVRVLEKIGTPEARQLLEELAKGAPSARLTVAAKAALERLRR
jgi:RNA polymerase sigma factor (sigma-70 family)